MKFCDITNVEDLVLTKYEIESILIKNGIIDKKYDLDSFITYIIDKTKNLYTYFNKETDKMTSFIIYKLDEEIYIFNIDIKNDLLNKLIEYALNISSLADVTNEWSTNDNIKDMLINNMKYYQISL